MARGSTPALFLMTNDRNTLAVITGSKSVGIHLCLSPIDQDVTDQVISDAQHLTGKLSK